MEYRYVQIGFTLLNIYLSSDYVVNRFSKITLPAWVITYVVLLAGPYVSQSSSGQGSLCPE